LAQEKTLAPRSAVIDTGRRQVAFVSLGRGKFEPRKVRLGVETGEGMVEVISGLKPGEIVVTSGQFLLDSEANIREALGKMIKGDLAADQQTAAPVAGASTVEQLPEPVSAALNSALQHYLAIGDALASDKLEGIAEQARQLATGLDDLVKLEVPADPHLWHQHQDAIATARSHAFKLIETSDLKQARLEFAQVSTALESLLKATGVPSSFGSQVQVLHCPMYREGQGGTIWLQTAGEVRNPYFGPRMLECFDQRQTMPTAGQEASTQPLLEKE
jgi:Cu(I)/Ag(I) efflux system membrane fusion protein